MPWKETCAVRERMRFVSEMELGEVSFSELCRRYAISRETGYKWCARYACEGPRGLEDRSRARHTQSEATSVAVCAAIVELRGRHPSWGPKKLRAKLAASQPEVRWPAQSTIGDVLKRRGLVVPRRSRLRVAASGGPLHACEAANDVWGIDFKGWFRTGDGRRCEPLSLSDLATRYVLRLQAVERTRCKEIWPLLEAAFREFGLPRAIRSDNGPPFAGAGAGGLSRLAVNVIKAGVVPERIAPGRPQQNGRHERLHLTVQLETASPPASSWRGQQRRFDAFMRMFNEERPHEALAQTPPAAHYRRSTRAYDGLRSPTYGDGDEVRRVRPKGDIPWRGHHVFIGEALAGEPIACTPIAEDRWRVHYADIDLGIIDSKGRFQANRTANRQPPTNPPSPPGGKRVNHVPG
jgi:putative transposase